MKSKKCLVAIYTREPKKEYTESLAHSIHLAYSEDGNVISCDVSYNSKIEFKVVFYFFS